MPVENINDVIQASLAYQRSRLEASAWNVAQANVPVSADGSPTARVPAAPAEFTRLLGTAPESANAQTAGERAAPQYRLAVEPGHPQADEHGIVRYPAVDLATEMTTMMTSSRAYEATVRSYNILRSMNAKAMEIGK